MLSTKFWRAHAFRHRCIRDLRHHSLHYYLLYAASDLGVLQAHPSILGLFNVR